MASEDIWKVSQEILDRNKLDFQNFLEQEYEGSAYYNDKIREAFDSGKKRVLVNLNHLRESDRKEFKFLTQGLIKNSREYLDPLQRTLQDVSRNIKISTN